MRTVKQLRRNIKLALKIHKLNGISAYRLCIDNGHRADYLFRFKAGDLSSMTTTTIDEVAKILGIPGWILCSDDKEKVVEFSKKNVERILNEDNRL